MASRRYRVGDVAPVLLETLRSVRTLVHEGSASDPALSDLSSRIEVATAARHDEEPADDLVELLIALVIHADGRAPATAVPSDPPMPPAALRIVVRSLLDRLAEQSPGRSVEVRVPPFAAVQCVEGPRHTRGTPANVIETDAWTWIRLAAGRLSWADAVRTHAVSASGARADLAAYLPVR